MPDPPPSDERHRSAPLPADVVEATREIEVELPGGERFTAQLLEVYQVGVEELVLYWFQAAGRWPGPIWLEHLLRPFDSVVGRPQYAFVRLSVIQDDQKDQLGDLKSFARIVAPRVRAILEGRGDGLEASAGRNSEAAPS